jgi:hypothetical protein
MLIIADARGVKNRSRGAVFFCGSLTAAQGVSDTHAIVYAQRLMFVSVK